MFYNYRTYNITLSGDMTIAGVELPKSYNDVLTLSRRGHNVILSIYENDRREIKNITDWVARYNQDKKEDEVAMFHFHFSVEDFHAPSQKVINDYLSKIIWCDTNKYSPVTHCRGGNGRTGTMLSAAVLFSELLRKMPTEIKRSIKLPFSYSDSATIDPLTSQAISIIREKSPHSVETKKQAESISIFCENFVHDQIRSMVEL